MASPKRAEKALIPPTFNMHVMPVDRHYKSLLSRDRKQTHMLFCAIRGLNNRDPLVRHNAVEALGPCGTLAVGAYASSS